MTKNKQKNHEAAALANLCSPSYLAKYGPRKLKIEDNLKVNYDNIQEVLVSHSYNVTEEGPESWHTSLGRCWSITGHGVRGVLYDDTYDIGIYAGYLHLDSKKCWNKLSQCPCRIKFPTTAGELFRALRQIGSPAGYFISNSFSFFTNNPFQNDAQGLY